MRLDEALQSLAQRRRDARHEFLRAQDWLHQAHRHNADAASGPEKHAALAKVVVAAEALHEAAIVYHDAIDAYLTQLDRVASAARTRRASLSCIS